MTTVPSRSTLWWVRPLALRSMIGALVAAAAVGIVSAISGQFGTVSGQALFTVGLFVVYALLSWYDADVSARRSAWFGTLSLGVTVYLLVIGVVKIWFPYQADGPSFFGDYAASRHPDFIGEFLSWLWLLVVARVALLHIHLLLFIYRKYAAGGMRLIAQLTFALVGLLALTLSLPVIFRGVSFPDLYWRAIAAIAILDSLGTILVPLVYSLFHRQPGALPTPSSSPVVEAEPHGFVGAAPTPHLPMAVTPVGTPPAHAYAPHVAEPSPLRLKWPQYEDGRPLPSRPDGTPDFTGVVGY